MEDFKNEIVWNALVGHTPRGENAVSPLPIEHLYEFDQKGFTILRGFLDNPQVEEMTRIIRAKHGDAPSKKFPFFELSPIFFDLATDPRLMATLKLWLGDGYRLDHVYGISQKPAKPGERVGEDLHGGQFQNQGSYFYNWFGGRSRCGLMACAFALTPSKPGDGGLVIVPGSHKQGPEIDGVLVYDQLVKQRGPVELTVQPELNPGDLVIFTESVVHGTFAWRPQDRARMTLYYKFSPGFLAWRSYEQIKKYLPLAKTETQRNLLRPPYVAGYEENDREMSLKNDWRTPTEVDHS